jgi:aryl-alcohol dehydrogenase-like predicted oxidoreductase
LAQPLIEVLRRVAAAHGATPSQVALAWLIRRPNVVVIPGASSVAQVEANAAAAELELSEADDEALAAASDAFHPRGVREVWPQLARERLTGLTERLKGLGPK